MCVYVCVCMCVCMCVGVWVYVCVCECVCMFVHMSACVHVRVWGMRGRPTATSSGNKRMKAEKL